jgi:hypothetical protein
MAAALQPAIGKEITYTTQWGTLRDSDVPVCTINGSNFVLFHQPIGGDVGNTEIDLEGYNLVILDPVTAGKNVVIRATHIIVLSHITAISGQVQIKAEGKCIDLGSKIRGRQDPDISGKLGVHSSAILEDRLDLITFLFREAAAEEDGKKCVEALAKCYDAIQDPYGEREQETNDIPEVLTFFGLLGA